MSRVGDSDAPVVVQHRLALGVTPMNSLTGAAIGDVAVVHESPIVGLGRRRTLADPLAAEVTGERVPGTRSCRFRLLITPRLGRGAVLLLFDDARRFVARRFDVPLWSPGRLTAPEAEPPGAFVPTAQRVFAPDPVAGLRLSAAGRHDGAAGAGRARRREDAGVLDAASRRRSRRGRADRRAGPRRRPGRVPHDDR